MKITFISVKERGSRTYMTDAIEAVNDLHIGKVLDDGHIDQLEEPTKRYETHE